MRSAATRLLASRLGTRRSRCITQSFQQQRYIAFDQSSRNSAIRSFFQHLEANYGNLSELIDRGPASETIVSPDGILHPHHLSRLFRHEATALHVQNYYHSADAARLGEEILLESMERTRSGGGSSNWKISTSRGLESSDVGTCGEHTPYNVAVAREYQAATAATATRGKPTALDEYFEGVQREFRSRRKRRCSSKTHDNASDYYQLWPLDKFRLDMDESWPSGAGLARETKQKGDDTFPRPFGGGLPRIMYGPTRWKRGFIHVDEMGPLNIHKGLFSANIYLKLPEKGSIKDAGDLYIWPLGVRSRWDWYRVSVRSCAFITCTPFVISLASCGIIYFRMQSFYLDYPLKILKHKYSFIRN